MTRAPRASTQSRGTSPDFIIVGAMKAGTTTLAKHLGQHPGIYMPADKEPEYLTAFGGDVDKARDAYRFLFRRAPQGAICGEASTKYTMAPSVLGVPLMARQVCGADLKIIYLTRDPIERIISHYQHERRAGRELRSLECALRAEPRYINYTKYSDQISIWSQEFSVDNIHVLDLSELINAPSMSLNGIYEFLGVETFAESGELKLAQENSSDERPIRLSIVRKMLATRLYRNRFKPLVPQSVRAGIRSLFEGEFERSKPRLFERDEAAVKQLLSGSGFVDIADLLATFDDPIDRCKSVPWPKG